MAKFIYIILFLGIASYAAQLPEKIKLLDQNGRKFTLSQISGQPVMISFVYTTCKMPTMCPLTVQLNKDLVVESKKVSQPLKAVLVTLDTETDTPSVLKEFAKSRDLDESTFTLVTGTEKNVGAFTSSFGASGFVMESGEIGHAPTSVLLDANLKELKKFYANNWKPSEVLEVLNSARKPATINFDDKKNWKTAVYELKDFKLDRTFAPMSGPVKQINDKLELSPATKRAWIKGMSLENIGNEKDLPQNLCHSQMVLPMPKSEGSRRFQMLTISNGMTSFEFPKGFGVPVHNDGSFVLNAQIMNDDPNLKKTFGYRIKVSFLEDPQGELLKPLSALSINAFGPPVEIKDGLVCETAVQKDGESDHFAVPPGKSIFTNVVKSLPVGPEAKIHYIQLHMHRYGQFLELFDKTENRRVWKGRVSYDKDLNITKTDTFSSEEGIPINSKHEYLVRCEFLNPTKRLVSGMCGMRTFVSENH
jgi:cytochrome oxidase Cu insertion factor (SCO1/SenC/PrrC family)